MMSFLCKMWLKAAYWLGWSRLISVMRITSLAPHDEREGRGIIHNSDFKKNHFYILNKNIDKK